MKTVQQLFREADAEQLVTAYLEQYPPKLENFDDDVTIGQAREICRSQLLEYIDRLRNVAVKAPADGGCWILYAYHTEKEGITEPAFDLTPLAEMKAKGTDAFSYAYELTDHAEIMGYKVAENHLTKYYQKELLVDVMFEASLMVKEN